jgi:hypothetical protein
MRCEPRQGPDEEADVRRERTTRGVSAFLLAWLLVFAGPPSPVSGEDRSPLEEAEFGLSALPGTPWNGGNWEPVLISAGTTLVTTAGGFSLIYLDSGGGGLAGGLLLLGGLTVGPSVGNFTQGRWGWALGYSGVRLLTASAAFVALIAETMHTHSWERDDSINGPFWAFLGITAAVAVWENVALYFSAPSEGAGRGGGAFSLAPTVLPIEENGVLRPAWGLTVQGAF